MHRSNIFYHRFVRVSTNQEKIIIVFNYFYKPPFQYFSSPIYLFKQPGYNLRRLASQSFDWQWKVPQASFPFEQSLTNGTLVFSCFLSPPFPRSIAAKKLPIWWHVLKCNRSKYPKSTNFASSKERSTEWFRGGRFQSFSRQTGAPSPPVVEEPLPVVPHERGQGGRWGSSSRPWLLLGFPELGLGLG